MTLSVFVGMAGYAGEYSPLSLSSACHSLRCLLCSRFAEYEPLLPPPSRDSGAVLWGRVSDALGRRRSVLISSVFSFVFGLLSSFAPTFPVMVLCRFLVGVGIGGVPVVYALFLEFVPSPNRGMWSMGRWSAVGLRRSCQRRSCSLLYLATTVSWVLCLCVCVSVCLCVIGLAPPPASADPASLVPCAARLMHTLPVAPLSCPHSRSAVVGRGRDWRVSPWLGGPKAARLSLAHGLHRASPTDPHRPAVPHARVAEVSGDQR
jgi:MFS family permease